MRFKSLVAAFLIVLAVVPLASADVKAHLMRAPDPCEGEGPWLLVYRYHFVNDDGVTQVEETFDGLRFATEELAFACAAKLRTTGVRLPTLPRYGRDSNVMPDLITPMPSLCAVEQGIRPTRQPRGAADPAP